MVGGTARLLKALRFFQKRRATPATLALAPHLSANACTLHAYAAGLPRANPHRLTLEPLLFRTVLHLSPHTNICTALRTSLHVSRTLWGAMCRARILHIYRHNSLSFSFASSLFSTHECIFSQRGFLHTRFKLYSRKNLEQFFLFSFLSLKSGTFKMLQVKLHAQGVINRVEIFFGIAGIISAF